MRLTVNLEPELYGIAKSVAREGDCSISTAVNTLLRKAVTAPTRSTTGSPRKRNGLPVSRGNQVITSDTVRRIEAEDDLA